MRVLVLGVTGMLGHRVFRVLSADPGNQVWGTLRDEAGRQSFTRAAQPLLLSGVDMLNRRLLQDVLIRIRPAVVINCVGLIKQLADAGDPDKVLPLNAHLPHALSRMCALIGARLIHISTDCVFSGNKGGYSENDPWDTQDLYGRSKALGELCDQRHAITLRTSIIGHELRSSHSLVEWFLSRTGPVEGYANAVFSGLPTSELARVIARHILPRPDLYGLFHVAAQPIDKYTLLRLIASVYGKSIRIARNEQVVVDRTLNGARFQAATGYVAPDWPRLIASMHEAR